MGKEGTNASRVQLPYTVMPPPDACRYSLEQEHCMWWTCIEPGCCLLLSGVGGRGLLCPDLATKNGAQQQSFI